jgi:hypothetical protein
MFFNPISTLFGPAETFDQSNVPIFPNDTTTYQFSNGSTVVLPNTAILTVPLNAGSGMELFEKYLVPQSSANKQQSQATTSASPTSSAASTKTSVQAKPTGSASILSHYAPLGFPTPMFASSDGSIAAFFLPNSSDTAVISIQSFLGKASAPFNFENPIALEFQAVTSNLLAAAREAGKTRLIIDIRGNGGGDIFLAYDFFKQLFPTKVPYSGTRFRAHPAANALGISVSVLGELEFGNRTVELVSAEDFNYRVSLKSPDGPRFQSWEELYGPKTVNGDTFSTVHSWDLSNTTVDIVSSGVVVSGYGNMTNIASSPFAASNITLVREPEYS